MRIVLAASVVAFCTLSAASAQCTQPLALPLRFEPAATTEPAFVCRADGGSLLVSADGLELARPGRARVRVRFLDADSSAPVDGLDPLPGSSHYLIGNDPAHWRRDVPHFGKVAVRDAWAGIDVLFRGHEGQLEFDFLVAPGASTAAIGIALEGHRDAKIDGSGNLVVQLDGGVLELCAPVAWEEAEHGRQFVPSRWWHDAGNGALRIAVERRDPSRRLVIDPVVAYSSYFGGSLNDEVHGVDVDALGNLYLTGVTISTDFPGGAPRGYYDAFVAKLDPTGSTLLWTAFIGGTGDFNVQERAVAIAVDALGRAVVTGRTEATDFPVVNASQPQFGGLVDAFACMLDPSGSSFVWSTYLGGSNAENDNDSDYYVWRPGDVVVDPAGITYVTGMTASADFPILNAWQSRIGGDLDAFVVQIAPTGAALASTFLGGSNAERGFGLALVPGGDVYVGGDTGSPDFPTTNGTWMPRLSTGGGFLVRFAAGLTHPTWSTFIPASVAAVASDQVGNAYLTGVANNCFPVTFGAAQTAFSPVFHGQAGEAYVLKLDPAGSAVVYATYYGASSGNEAGEDIAVDALGHAHVGGTRFETRSPASSSSFLFKLNPAGTAFLWSQSFGGRYTSGLGVALDPTSGVVLAGTTSDAAFPTTANAFQRSYRGTGDGFVVKVVDAATMPVAVRLDSPRLVRGTSMPGSVTLDGPAPAGGLTVMLASSAAAVVVPSTLLIPAGATMGSFPIGAAFVAAPVTATIRASYGGVDASAAVRVWFGPAYESKFLGAATGFYELDARGINRFGDVVGKARASDGYDHAYLFTDAGGLVDLGRGIGNAINDRGQIAGDTGFNGIAWRYTPGVGFQTLGSLPGGWFSTATAISASGEVAAYGDDATGNQRALRWTQSAGYRLLGSLGGDLANSYGINARGDVVGMSFVAGNGAGHAFRFTDAQGMRDLGTLAGSTNSVAFAINEAGQVVGLSADSGYSMSRAFRWTEGAGMVDLGTLPGATSTRAHAVNSFGHAVGTAGGGAAGTKLVRFVDGLPVEDLADQLDPRDAFQWLELETVTALNDAGQAAARGRIKTMLRGEPFCGWVALRLDPVHYRSYGVGCAGFAGREPSLGGVGTATRGQTMRLCVGNGPPAGVGVVYFSTARGSLPLPGGCTLLLGGPLVSVGFVGLDALGQASLPIPIPQNLTPVALPFQWFGLDPRAANGVFTASGAVEVRVR